MKEAIGRILTKFNIGLFRIKPRQSLEFAKKYFGRRKITVIEIGTSQGGHALQILQNLNIEKIYLIDPWIEYNDYLKSEPDSTQKRLNKNLEICKKRLAKYKDRVFFIKDFSDKAVKSVPKSDYIYVDGNHEHEYVKKDLKNYWPKVKKGGIFAGNDIQTLGVSGALIEFCYKNKLVPYIKHVDWWVVKRKD